MNREIKFRAWDKVKKTFNRSIEIDCLGGMQEYKYTGSAYQAVYDVDMGGFSEANERFVLQQYTGLKDSEGVEIYEGDRLKKEHYTKVNILTGKESKQYSQRTIEISYENGSFCYSIINQENSYFGPMPSPTVTIFTTPLDRYEIIGNIFEPNKNEEK